MKKLVMFLISIPILLTLYGMSGCQGETSSSAKSCGSGFDGAGRPVAECATIGENVE